MLKAIRPSQLNALLLLSLVWLTACKDPQTVRQNELLRAAELQASGEHDAALQRLEALRTEAPNDVEILRRIAAIYTAKDDATMAALFLEQAYQQDPTDLDLLYQTYMAQRAAGEAAGELLETLAVNIPDKMTAELWAQLGQYRMQRQQTEAALEAFLKCVPQEVNQTDPGTATAIGQLFLQLDNQTQAEQWFNRAADSENLNALNALFGLLEIKLGLQDWQQAEAIIAQLDLRFPGAVDASEWAQARTELLRWREELATAQAELAKATVNEAAEAVTASQPPLEPETGNMPATTTDAPPTTGKTRVLADLEAIEAMADQPAIEAVAEDAEQASPALEDEAVADSPMEPSVAELLEEADRAQLEGDYDSAIGLYWQALATANNDPATWNQLSQAYFAINQLQNAETAALEAIRFAPSEIKFTLDYLRIAQRSKPATQFLAELETAYDRFPSNPEVALSLARAHERIGNNSRAAQSLYRRFLEIAPNHPLRAEADAALARLR